MPSKDARLDINTEFELANHPGVVSAALHTHRVARGTLKGSDVPFVRKEVLDPALARLELLAQEFFRLIIFHQPETYLAVDQDSPTHKGTGVHYILSQEVSGYKLIPKGQAEKFKENGEFSGLGQVCLVSRFLQEEDLKNGNLGLNDKNQVIKIDGDKCFSELRKKHDPAKPGYKISPRSINKLPYPLDFYAYNWLDFIKEGVAKPVSAIVTPDLSESPKFKAEINQAMLRICLLPDGFLEEFVDAYMPAGGQRFLTFFATHRDELRASALTSASFVDYINSPAAATDMEQFTTHLKTFKANRTELVNKSSQLENRVKAHMQEMQLSIVQAKTLIAEITPMITVLRAIAAPGKNIDLDNYLTITAQNLKNAGHDPAQIIGIKNDLAKKLLLPKGSINIQESSELMAVSRDLLHKIRVMIPPGQNAGLDAYIENYSQKTQQALFEPEVLKKLNATLLVVPKALELIKTNNLLVDEIRRHSSEEDTAPHFLNQIKICGYDADALAMLHGHIMEVLATTLNKEIESYIVNDSDKELINYVKKMAQEITSSGDNPLKLEALHKSLREKLFPLLKKECEHLLQELQKVAKVDPHFIEHVKTNDLNQLAVLKKQLMQQQSLVVDMMEIQRQITVIRSSIPMQANAALHSYLKEAELVIRTKGADSPLIKRTLADLKIQYELIQQAEGLQKENRILFAKINLCIDSKQNKDFTDHLIKEIPQAIAACGHDPQLLATLKTELQGTLVQLEQSVKLINECRDLLEQFEKYNANPASTKIVADKLLACGQDPNKLTAIKKELETNVRIAWLNQEIACNLDILTSYKFGNGDLILAQYIQERRQQTQNNSQNLEILNKVHSKLLGALSSVESEPIMHIKKHIANLRSRGQPYIATADHLENTLATMPYKERGAFIKEQLEKIQNTKINIPAANANPPTTSVVLNMKERLAQMKNLTPVPTPEKPPAMVDENVLISRVKL